MQKRLLALLLTFLLLASGMQGLFAWADAAESDNQGLFAGRFSYQQVFDCSRSPAFPEAGEPFRAQLIGAPYQYTKAQIFNKVFYFEGEANPDGTIKTLSFWMANNVDKVGAIKIATNGKIYGLDNGCFLFVVPDHYLGIGYFISNSTAYKYGQDVTYIPDMGEITQFDDLLTYEAGTEPLYDNRTFYDPNGGEGEVWADETIYSSGGSVEVLFSQIPERDGYEFLGWSESRYASAAQFTENGEKTFVLEYFGKYLFATWRNLCTCELNSPIDITIYLPRTAPSISLDMASLWSLQGQNECPIDGHSTATDSDIQWEITRLPGNASQEDGIITFFREDFGEIETNASVNGISKQKEIFVMVVNGLGIYYNANGGTGGPALAGVADGTTEYTVVFTPAPTRAGYDFLGWATTPGATVAEFTETGLKVLTDITADVTLYAVWHEIPCTCTLNAPTFSGEAIQIGYNDANATRSLSASGSVLGGDCSLAGHAGAEVRYSYVVKSGAGATVSGSTLMVTQPSTVVVTATATANGKTATTDATFTVTRQPVPPSGTSGVSGTIFNDAAVPAPMAGVTVRLMRGEVQKAQMVTGADGAFSFGQLAAGTYRLIAEIDSRSASKTVKLDDSMLAGQNLTILSGGKSVAVDVAPNTPPTEAENLENMFVPGDQQLIEETGGTIEIKLVVKKLNETALDQNEVQRVEAALGETQTVGIYIDAVLLKIIAGMGNEHDGETKIQPPGGQKVRITLEIPEELRNKARYSVIRVHEGAAEVIDDVEYDNILHTITFETDRFSTFALVYTESEQPPEGPNPPEQPNPKPPAQGLGSSSESERENEIIYLSGKTAVIDVPFEFKAYPGMTTVRFDTEFFQGANGVASLTSGYNGSFSLTPIKAGVTSLVFSRSGYADLRVDITIASTQAQAETQANGGAVPQNPHTGA